MLDVFSLCRFKQRQSTEGLTWHQILETVKREARDVPKDTVTGVLKELPLIARDIGNSEYCGFRFPSISLFLKSMIMKC